MQYPIKVVSASITALIIAVTARSTAQVPAADTAAKSAGDSTLRPPRSSADTARPLADTSHPRAAPRPLQMSMDTVLTQACGPSGRGAADGLLAVTFDPVSAPVDRAAAAKQVGGTLVPRSGAADNEYYIRLPAGGSEQQLRVLADQLILVRSVRIVGSVWCPAPVPADTSQAQDTLPGSR
jgi:hypothetical protein